MNTADPSEQSTMHTVESVNARYAPPMIRPTLSAYKNTIITTAVGFGVLQSTDSPLLELE